MQMTRETIARRVRSDKISSSSSCKCRDPEDLFIDIASRQKNRENTSKFQV